MPEIKKDQEMSLEEALNLMKQSLSIQITAQTAMAILARAKYEALKQAGFTERQALELCRTPIQMEAGK